MVRVQFEPTAEVGQSAGVAMYNYADLGVECPTNWLRVDETPPTYNFTDEAKGQTKCDDGASVTIVHHDAQEEFLEFSWTDGESTSTGRLQRAKGE